MMDHMGGGMMWGMGLLGLLLIIVLILAAAALGKYLFFGKGRYHRTVAGTGSCFPQLRARFEGDTGTWHLRAHLSVTGALSSEPAGTIPAGLRRIP
jgi:hypothetical protein